MIPAFRLLFILALIAFHFESSAIAQDLSSFDSKSFLKTHCLDCHSGKAAEGDIDLSSFDLSLDNLEKTEFAIQVLAQLEADLMPPRDESELTRLERVRAIEAIRKHVLSSPHGKAYRQKMLLPEFGNYVDHDLLFSGAIKTPGFTYSRIWRISPYIFDSRRRVGKVKGIQNPFTFSTKPNGIRDYAEVSIVDSSVVETILMNSRNEFEYLVTQARKEAQSQTGKRRRRNAFVPFVGESKTVTDEDMVSVVRSTMERVYARSVSEKEIDRFKSLLRLNIEKTNDPLKSLQTVFQSIYVSAPALYRFEMGTGPADSLGRKRLRGRELAEALAYALYDQSPFQGGRSPSIKIGQALTDGKLESKEEIRTLLESLLNEEKFPPGRGSSTPRIMRFFREYFGYHHAMDVFKDNQRVNEHGLYHDPRQLVGDLENLIKVILREDKDVFEKLLTTRGAFVFHSGDNTEADRRHQSNIDALAEIDDNWARERTQKRINGVRKKPKYKANAKLLEREIAKIRSEESSLARKERERLQKLIAAGPSMKPVKSRNRRYAFAYNLSLRTWEWQKTQPFELPADQRAGILTHPAWLAAHSTNDDNDPVHRGIWVYEKLLAGVIADVPPDVDARVPENAKQTLRERLQVVREQSCWKCHYKINPLGESFEVFDDFGRFRSHFYFDEEDNLITQSHRSVEDENGKTGFRAINRDAQVKQGKFTTRKVDSKGSFDGLDFEELSGNFNNAIEMIHQISKTDRARQSMIRHLFRYLLGRNEMLSDSQTLIAADWAYLENGGSFKAAVISILTSDSFLYRRVRSGNSNQTKPKSPRE